jgi:hypothetical protein
MQKTNPHPVSILQLGDTHILSLIDLNPEACTAKDILDLAVLFCSPIPSVTSGSTGPNEEKEVTAKAAALQQDGNCSSNRRGNTVAASTTATAAERPAETAVASAAATAATGTAAETRAELHQHQ